MVTAAWQLSNLGGDCLVTCLLTIRQCSCVRGFFERPLAERGKTLPPPSTGSFSVGGGRRCVSVEQPSGSYCDPPSLLTILSGRGVESLERSKNASDLRHGSNRRL